MFILMDVPNGYARLEKSEKAAREAANDGWRVCYEKSPGKAWLVMTAFLDECRANRLVGK